MPQYDYVMATRRLGQVARDINWTIDSYTNQVPLQIYDVTVGGATDGTFTIRIQAPEGDLEFSFVAATSTVSLIVAGLVAAASAVNLPGLINVATVTDADPIVRISFLHATGVDVAVDFPSNPGTDMTGANAPSAVGTVLPLGVAVAPGADDDTCILPSGAVTILGITSLNPRSNLNTGDSTQVDGTVPGQVASVLRQGVITVQATQAVTAGAAVYARNAAATVALPLGSLSDSATSSVVIPGARWRTSTTAAGLADVTINNP